MPLKITRRPAAREGNVSVKSKDAAELIARLHAKAQRGELRLGQARLEIENAMAEHGRDEFFRGETTYRNSQSRGANIDWEDHAEAARKGRSRGVLPETAQKAYELAITGPVGATPMLSDAADVGTQHRLHELHDGFVLCKALIPDYIPQRSRRWKEYGILASRLTTKVMTTQSGGSGTGTGGDFIPDMLSGTIVDLYRQELVIAANLNHFTMPWSPFTLPLEGVDTNAYFVGEASDDLSGSHSADVIPARTPATTNSQFSAKNLKVRGLVSEEAEEDAIFSMVDYMRKKLVEAQAQSLDDLLVNGDDSSTHQDSDVTSATDHRKAFDGLRFLADTTSPNFFDTGGQLEVKDFLNPIGQQGKFAQRPEDTMLIVSPIGMTHIIDDANVQTVDKLGPAATLIRGQVASLWGRPVQVSGKIREDLNNSGVYDASTTTKTIALVVHRPSFMVGDRRQITVESAKDISTGKTIVVTTTRVDFKRTQAETTTPIGRNVGVVYNINSAATF